MPRSALEGGASWTRGHVAALCSIRIIKKVPDLDENFVNPAAGLLKEKHHGFLITGLQLYIDLCATSAEALEYFRKEYVDLLHEFMAAVKQNYGEKVLVQFEDFTDHNAFELLEKYGSTHLVFNDDIQVLVVGGGDGGVLREISRHNIVI